MRSGDFEVPYIQLYAVGSFSAGEHIWVQHNQVTFILLEEPSIYANTKRCVCRGTLPNYVQLGCLRVDFPGIASDLSFKSHRSMHATHLTAPYSSLQTSIPTYFAFPVPFFFASSCGHCTKHLSTTLLSMFPLKLIFFTRAQDST